VKKPAGAGVPFVLSTIAEAYVKNTNLLIVRSWVKHLMFVTAVIAG